ncbi:MAG: FAD-dependent 5-carboxymethylaminomethyl-2-thiouridine(34) oxidoreductase MnmC [Rhizobacter sp.]|nr:FAD-dependent 5-carboxymethylaminomethyl-2-thiouridine(34) oxidoreductase MnmC [Rhizobacter sp.]
MRTAPVAPADILFDGYGTPRSPTYGDVYHPRSGAFAQARHVFLANGALAERWRGRSRFVILETGFGLGNNFLATWSAWRDDPARPRRLHFVSIDSSPPTRATFAAVPREAPLAPLAVELAERWPPLTCNLHRMAFDDDAVELLLAFGDAAAWLPQLAADVDAFFLDGFAPARNPAMWEPRLFKAMARLAAPDATVATWSAARRVRDALAGAGFVVERTAGRDGKRDITRARFAPRVARRAMQTSCAADVVVVGAGLAGCATAAALARRGVRALVVERAAEVATEASGNAAALFHGVVHRDDGRYARFHRAAALAGASAVRDAIERHGVPGSASGLLRLETRLDLATMQAIVAAQALPADYVVAVDADAASQIAGARIRSPTWHYPTGGWVDPRALASAWLGDASPSSDVRLGTAVGSLRRVDGRWRVAGNDGALIATADAVVLCDGSGMALLGPAAFPVQRQRGQTTAVAATLLAALPRVPVVGCGHVVPPLDGFVWTGTSAAWHDDDVSLRSAEQRRNLERLQHLLGLSDAPDLDALTGRVAFRWTSADRLPIAGPVPATIAAAAIAGCAANPARQERLRLVPRAPGLFVCAALGSRGVAAAALTGEIVAARIAGTPVPAEADLVDAIDPARFAVRRVRREAAATASEGAAQPPVGPIAGSFGG